jgi:ribose transport system substrate-binding protein
MCVADPSTPYVQAFIAGAKEEAAKVGVNIKVVNGQRNNTTILDAMDTAITQHVDGFIQAGAQDQQAIVPGVIRLNEANIPVFAIDTSPNGGKVAMFISFDIYSSSVKAANLFVDGIKKRNGGQVPSGVVIEITGSVTDNWAQTEMKAFHSVMKQYPQLKVATADGQWSNDVANQRTSDLLTRYGDQVKGIFVQTPDIMGAGVVAAIKAAGKNPADYGITGICIGPEGIAMIKKGELLGAVEQPALDQARLAVKYLADLCRGNPIPKIGTTVVEKGQIWSPAKVTKNPYADGAFMVLQGPLVPQELPVTDPRLWENKLSYMWTNSQ